MSKTPWTPSPWRVGSIGLTNQGQRPIVDDNGQIALVAIRDESAPSRNLWVYDDQEREANARLIAQSPRMAEAMQWFCDRVDAGEVQSTKTYNLFKDILSDVYGEGS